MKRILMTSVLCLFYCGCSLQAQERFAFSGAGYYDGAQVKGVLN